MGTLLAPVSVPAAAARAPSTIGADTIRGDTVAINDAPSGSTSPSGASVACQEDGGAVMDGDRG